MVRLKEEQGIWIATPKEVNRWWRAREKMNLSLKSGEWQIEGPESDRARVAFARVEEGQLVFRLREPSEPHRRLSQRELTAYAP
jgi:hypothetical protein